MRTRRSRLLLLLLTATALGAGGCGSGPNKFSFRSITHPMPMVRARAASMADGQPDVVAVPALIDRLNDHDPVVTMSANEALKKRTGKDFGFVPWAGDAERARAVGAWKGWWDRQPKPALVKNGATS